MNPLVLVLALILLAGFVYMFFQQRKYLALYVIIIVLFLPKINIFTLTAESKAGLRSEDLIIAFFMLFTVFGEKCKSYKKVFSNNIFKFFLLFLGSSVISFFIGLISKYTYSVSLSFFSLLRKVEYFCFIFVGYDLYYFNRGNMRFLLKKTLSLFVIYTAFISIFQMLGLVGSFRFGIYDPTSFVGVAVGTFNGYYELGAFFVFTAIIYLYDIIMNIDNKWFNFAFFAVSLLLILFSSSRTSLLVMLILMAIIVVVYSRTKVKIWILLTEVSLVILTILLLKFTDIAIFERFRTIHFDSLWNSVKYYFENRSYSEYISLLGQNEPMENYVLQTGDVSFNTRMFKWMAMLDAWSKFPLFGYGFGSNSTIDGNYIKLLAENGLVGFVLFVSVFVVTARETLKCKSKSSYCVIWILLSLFLGAILIDLFEASKVMEFVWFLIGACCVEGKNVKEEIRQEIVSEKTSNTTI